MQSHKRFIAWLRKTTLESFLALSWPKQLPSELKQSQNVLVTHITTWGKTTVHLGQRSNQKRLTQAANGEEDTDSQPVHERN